MLDEIIDVGVQDCIATRLGLCVLVLVPRGRPELLRSRLSCSIHKPATAPSNQSTAPLPGCPGIDSQLRRDGGIAAICITGTCTQGVGGFWAWTLPVLLCKA